MLRQALIWAKMSTDMYIEIRSAQPGKPITYCKLDINIQKNEAREINRPPSSDSRRFLTTRDGRWE